MVENKDIEFVKKCIKDWYNKCPEGLVTLESKELLGYDIEDSGVPKDMEDGKADEEGYVKWKLTSSSIDEESIQNIEDEYNVHFPKLYRSYLMSYHHLGICLKDKERKIYLPEIPSDLPLKQIEFELDAWKPLVDAGYIPFADYEDGWGPVCFDIMNRNKNDDCPIIWFDHEELFNSDFEKGKSRLELDKMKKKLYSSFQELMSNLCL